MMNEEKIIKQIKYYQGLTSLQCLTFPNERAEFHETMTSILELMENQKNLIEEAEERGFAKGQNNMLEAQAEASWGE